MGKRLLPSNRNPVPGHQGQQAGHATKTTDAGKYQAGSHKPTEQDPGRRHPAAEAQTEQHQRASGDLNLARQRQGGWCARAAPTVLYLLVAATAVA